MRQFSYFTSKTDNYSGKTSEEGNIVSVKRAWYNLPKCESINFCCNPSSGYGIMNVDGFIFLAYDCHSQGPYNDLNPDNMPRPFFLLHGSVAWLS